MPFMTEDEMEETTKKVAMGGWKNLPEQERRDLLADFETVEFHAMCCDLRDYRATMKNGFIGTDKMPIEEVDARLQEAQNACVGEY
jgi:hypothetical protein